MRRIAKDNKAGFTLVEVMLAIAITLLISGMFVSLIIATHSAYYTTYNYNDSTDYCQLFGKIMQDKILSDRQDSSFTSGTRKYMMNSSICQFTTASSTVPIVEVPRVTNSDGTLKWIFAVSDVTFDSTTNVATIEITVVDNCITPGDILYTYDVTFWVPNLVNDAGAPVGDSITISRGVNHQVTSGTTTVDNYEIEVTRS